MATKLPSIPDISESSLKRAVIALKEIAEVRNRRRGDPLDRFVSYRELLSSLESDDQISTVLTEVIGLASGTNTGDILRWNATTEAWEVKAEPLSFTQITLTPQAAAVANAEGGLYYNSAQKAVLVCVDS